MKKVLFFPLLRMPSGHHQVADTVAEYLEKYEGDIECKKIDLLSEWNPLVESIVTKTYLEWIHYMPETYAWVYKQMACKANTNRSYKYYEFLFLKKMKRILEEENPDLIICTHGFPSYILNQLKNKNECDIPVINVYTDFFINDVWGKRNIDYHFVPTEDAKIELIKKYKLSEASVSVTGIPVSRQFYQVKKNPEKKSHKIRVLVSGGSVGLGNIFQLLTQTRKDDIEYFVLCGKNKNLYQKIANLNCNNIHPLSYISSREKMNELYDKVDAVITKPGGVTISEALKKELPIFIHSALPGQEEINLKLLAELKLVQLLEADQLIEDQLINYFNNPELVSGFNHALQEYLIEVSSGHPVKISSFIHSLMNSTNTSLNRRCVL
ncbi:galactosyldiacylglycerol synthase [Bacillus luteolus]|uniref:Galactosyldiacylglycerol synthase n=1 Tax=Litchfieldia luteola TaxID=682179 RepID=A0ABR9QEK2_9BACI|nr:glycosyltransferase [Cytobacillus luteolus]MBE4906925.1 galactosyldiacylglycerol synthase [Cytobacillus luteolus]MBP1943612.1 UDP-N-acetylglucosamine:LPS N-acetylglucosamine transferase [Cytobacillus luteolus]